MKILNNDELNLKMEVMGGLKVKEAINLFKEMKDSPTFNKLEVYKDLLDEKAKELDVDINNKYMKDRISDSLLMQDIMFFLDPEDGIKLFSLKTFDYLYDKTNVWEQAIKRFGLDPNTIDPSTLPNLGLPIEEENFNPFDLNNYKNKDISNLNIGKLIYDNSLIYINNLEMQLFRENSYMFKKYKSPDDFYDFGEWLYESLNPNENKAFNEFLNNNFFNNESIQEEFYNLLKNTSDSLLKKDFNNESINIIKNSKNYNEIHEQIHKNDIKLTYWIDKFLLEKFSSKLEQYENKTLEFNDENKEYIKIFDNAKLFYDKYLDINDLVYDKYASLILNLEEEKKEKMFEKLEFGHKILIKEYLNKYGNVEFPIDLDEKFKIKEENIPLIVDMIKGYYTNKKPKIYSYPNKIEEQLNFLLDHNYNDEAKNCFNILKDKHKENLSEELLDKINNLDLQNIER